MAERPTEALEAGRQALRAAEGVAEGEHGKPHARSWSESDEDGGGDEEEEDDGGMTEALEELILDAYNSMQSDGEFIFLPDHVARKLHEAARLLQAEDEGQATEPSPEPTAASSDSDSARPLSARDGAKTDGGLANAAGGGEGARGEFGARHREQQPPMHVVTRDLLPRTRSSELLFTDLAPVIETDEEESSGPSSPAGDRSDKQESHTTNSSTVSPQPLPPPPPPPSNTHPTSTRSHSASHHPKSHAASPATTPRTADKKESESTYEKRRLAALKLKEDKARRAQEKHDAAKKQREDARRELEEVQRKEMEEKRERVRRMRQQREQRKASTTAKPAR